MRAPFRRAFIAGAACSVGGFVSANVISTSERRRGNNNRLLTHSDDAIPPSMVQQQRISKHDVLVGNVALLSGTANPLLAKKVAEVLNIKLTEVETQRYSDGEVSVSINESIRGKDVFILQTCAAPVNDNIMELLLTITAARRSGANRIIAVVPYFAYKYHRRGLPISSLSHSRFLWSATNDLAKMLQTVGVDGVLSVDLQRPGQGHEACFFDVSIPVETLTSVESFVDYFKTKNLNGPVVVVSPNIECEKRARKFQKKLKATFPSLASMITYALFVGSEDKLESGGSSLSSLGQAADSKFLGSVAGADVIIVDDIVETGVTLSVLCQRLKRLGAKRVFLCAPHGLFTKDSIELINLSPVEAVIVSDSVPLPENIGRHSKIHQVSIATQLAKIIEKEALHNQEHHVYDNDLDEDEDDIEYD